MIDRKKIFPPYTKKELEELDRREKVRQARDLFIEEQEALDKQLRESAAFEVIVYFPARGNYSYRTPSSRFFFNSDGLAFGSVDLFETQFNKEYLIPWVKMFDKPIQWGTEYMVSVGVPNELFKLQQQREDNYFSNLKNNNN